MIQEKRITASNNPCFLIAKEPTFDDPCVPDPCGSNAECNNGECNCLPEYQGNPYTGCRPECVLNSDCPRDKACNRNKCYDPCLNTCGHQALCEVINHVPMCSCPSGMSGSPFIQCEYAKRKFNFFPFYDL